MRIFYTWLALIMLQAISPGVSASQHKEAKLKAVASHQSSLASRAKAPDVLISFDNDGGTKYAIVVEKDTQQLLVYSYDDSFKEMYRFKCSTGEVAGGKSRSGDKKTPEGVYFFTHGYKKRDLSPTYGTMAFPIDYPNFFDRIEGCKGYSIWLHGTDKPIKPRNSNGCVVLANNDINRLAKYIDLNRTPIIIVDKLSFVSADNNNGIKNSILKLISQWKDALENGTCHEYLNSYSDEYAPDILWWSDWAGIKKSFQASQLELSVELKRNSIFRHNGIYMILFDQIVSSSGINLLVGRKKLYVSDTEGRFRIVGEEYQSVSKRHNSSKQKYPLVAASCNLKSTLEGKYEIEDLIDGWLKAWSDRDIRRYGKYYANNFRSRGMNLRSWLKYKNRLNREYKFINVSKDKLVIKKGKKRAEASFVQTYESNVFEAVGIKRLILIREKGLWKIYRETCKNL